MVRKTYNNGEYEDVTKIDEEGIKQGAYTYYWPNGGKAEGTYVNGVWQGAYTYYWPNGEKVEGTYVNGVRQGAYTLYLSSGEIEEEGTYVDGKKHGPATYYRGLARITEKYNYENGTIKGPYTATHPNLKKVMNLSSEDKLSRFLYETRMYSDFGNYGEFYSYVEKGNYDGKKNGPFEMVIAPRDGIEAANAPTYKGYGNYKNGRLDGKFVIKSDDGKEWYEANYKDGVLDGTLRIKGREGYAEYNYKNGMLDGVQKKNSGFGFETVSTLENDLFLKESTLWHGIEVFSQDGPDEYNGITFMGAMTLPFWGIEYGVRSAFSWIGDLFSSTPEFKDASTLASTSVRSNGDNQAQAENSNEATQSNTNSAVAQNGNQPARGHTLEQFPRVNVDEARVIKPDNSRTA